MTTPAERTARVPQENRVVRVHTPSTSSDRVARVAEQNRTVLLVERRPSQEERTVYVSED